MKYYILLASLVGLTVAAPLTGSATGSLTANNADIDIAASTKNFTAIMYLLAPDSWVNAWNEIPDEGKQCFLKTATNPANAEIYNSEDNEKIKNDLKSKCASSYDQLAKFCDQTDATMKQLPKSFTDISKSWGQQMQDLGNQYKNAGSNAATQNADAVKSMITQFAKPTGDYFNKLAALSQEDRQKLSDAFPKLQPIFSGEHSVEFLKEITQLYQTMGNGDFNPDSYKDTGKNLVNTWGSIWNEYKSRNANGLKKAGDLVGKDLTQAGDEIANQMAAKANGMFTGTFTGGAFPASGSVSASGPMGTNTFGVIGKVN